jgi:plastocyanin
MVAGSVPTRSGQPSIVVLQPTVKTELPSQVGKPVMDQVALTFIPGVLVVRTGAPTEFRNSDDVLHNVRVNEDATKQGTFNVAIPTGEVYVHTFERDGFYDVGCDIHPGMSAAIFASTSPWAAVTDVAGRFEIYNVPPGEYTARMHVGAETIERPVQVVAGRTTLDVRN